MYNIYQGGDNVKQIIILNGAARKNGNTAELVKAFTDGADSSGNSVRDFYLTDMNIHGCKGGECCSKTSADNPCAKSDDMREIYKAFEQADVVVFASPVYFWTISRTLKTHVYFIRGDNAMRKLIRGILLSGWVLSTTACNYVDTDIERYDIHPVSIIVVYPDFFVIIRD